MSEDILSAKGKDCIKKHSGRALKASFVPFVSLPLVHGVCFAMFSELDIIFGTSAHQTEKLSNIAAGILATPFMAVPVWGGIAARAYVQTVGESYLSALLRSNYGKHKMPG